MSLFVAKIPNLASKSALVSILLIPKNYNLTVAIYKKRIMEFIKRILLVSVLALIGVICNPVAAQQLNADFRTGPVTDPIGENYKTPAVVEAPLSRVTFYRVAQGYGVGATGLEINGHYHTSLQLGSYSELCMSGPVKAMVTSRLVRVGELVKNVRDGGIQIELQPAQETYVRVADLGNGRASFNVIDPSTAKTELRQARRQIHTVSRVPNAVSCAPQDVALATSIANATQIEVITLGSDALFEFGKFDIAGISYNGRGELDKLIARLQTRYGTFDQKHIQIIGYADPLGTDASNKRLSFARASTIKNYMIAGGIPANKITSEGRGSTSPIVANCPRVATPESIACNKPNRRVVVGVAVLTR
jgi:OOP family OmpA-OmpF porin